ncbi:hypothetical protein [Nitrosococcus oceani]|uniref:Uncharacterized protein n=2 Tax=Nitrosococcus oceani TaxID=1229 RepID=Q3JD56_NITOC|nr:hypothetical protein [Nitrosococcus oceani]KFI20212.1 hypothetical protein IB75_03645 [Nitrosococcus oceani C-27]ABA57240.1 hypothetical protein Noc_0726 [Nitrosococcus oceani ATCC 19707]EDZ66188.1 hypothetical protein NOC27_2868 [Nitrosococcus oceani AFC27]KFI23316.1 hypothetical protein HW44_03535 [Nitrosococcus oceani]GEM20111.1 hypothetical protein NONS58_15180 [Nitrosococcus oceani]
MQQRYNSFVLLFCLSFMGLGFAQDQGEEAALKDRASVFWKARVQEDWATVYNFLPSETRSKTAKEQFVAFRQKKGPFRYLSSEIGKVAVAGDKGWVELHYTAQPYNYPEISPDRIEMWEPWQIREKQWYPVPPQLREQMPKLPPHLRPAEEEAALSRRADEFWKAKEAQNWDLIYRFLEPSYRAEVSKAEFLSKQSLFVYVTHRFEWVEVRGNQGRVNVVYSRKLNDPTLYKLQPEEDSMIAEWVKVDGVWYRHVELPSGGES